MQTNTPQVKIVGPDELKTYGWGEQVTYTITVSDPTDGESKYDEIPAQECLLSVDYVPGNQQEDIKEVVGREEDKGLSLIKTSTCFGCHAVKTRLAGPSFQEIAGKYKASQSTITQLANHIRNGSTGVWGDLQMPAHPDFTEDQTKLIARFVLEIGGQPHRWVYPGLEGAFRIMNKPQTDQNGFYVLTASYTSTSGATGKHSIVLKIK
jgi:cytochrome c